MDLVTLFTSFPSPAPYLQLVVLELKIPATANLNIQMRRYVTVIFHPYRRFGFLVKGPVNIYYELPILLRSEKIVSWNFSGKLKPVMDFRYNHRF
jgi:hypothetical protein